MNASIEALEVVHTQLGRIETALLSLYRDVAPVNAANYKVMSESYIDLLLSMRREMDAYLGIAPTPATAFVTLTFNDDLDSPLPAHYVLSAVQRFQQGLCDIVERLAPPMPLEVQRGWVKHVAGLPLLGMVQGQMAVMLGEPGFEQLVPNVGQRTLHEALTLFFDGFDWLEQRATTNNTFTTATHDLQRVVLRAIARLWPATNSPLAEFQCRWNGESTRTAILRRTQRPRWRRARRQLTSATDQGATVRKS